MTFHEDDWLPISALQHYLFCNRRAALIHTEGLWAENRFTSEGTLVHRRADDPRQNESRRQKRTMRGIALCSHTHGLTGKADVIEFLETPSGSMTATIIEYKRGHPKSRFDAPYRTQLCAQALCVEDMLGCEIPRGFLYFAKANKRVEVPIDETLRQQTLATIAALHELIRSGRTPPPIYKSRKCKACSLIGLCLPTAPRPRKTASKFVDSLIEETPIDE
ncbi:CRISPR-associated protein Cas4 [Roseiconus lacunae]|uniref:CRISPR-associated protein Cas4 n=1 Tax=Roseiconus lacunae TaxID=2605694 RepID=UPI00308995BA|nr:CRISPR-associated protein Cas4 [Stieleria sp. HD01]